MNNLCPRLLPDCGQNSASKFGLPDCCKNETCMGASAYLMRNIAEINLAAQEIEGVKEDLFKAFKLPSGGVILLHRTATGEVLVSDNKGWLIPSSAYREDN